MVAQPEDDSDDCEEWVAADNGGFRLARPATSAYASRNLNDAAAILRARRHAKLGIALAVVAIIGAALQRGAAFWCSARGIPLGTCLRTPGFSFHQMPDLTGRTAVRRLKFTRSLPHKLS